MRPSGFSSHRRHGNVLVEHKGCDCQASKLGLESYLHVVDMTSRYIFHGEHDLGNQTL
jgi:hypothetical protein